MIIIRIFTSNKTIFYDKKFKWVELWELIRVMSDFMRQWVLTEVFIDHTPKRSSHLQWKLNSQPCAWINSLQTDSTFIGNVIISNNSKKSESKTC
jgi:hypothetical protein